MTISFFGSGRDMPPHDSSPMAENPANQFAAIHELRAYWEGLRDGPALPRREQIDPRGIAGALEQAFILERIAPGMARFRLAGMQIVDLMGIEVRGMPLSAMFDPAGRTTLSTALETLFTSPAIVDLRLEAERGLGKPALSARMMILPILGTGDKPDMAIGCIVTTGDIGRRPRRFFISNVTVEPLPGKQSPVVQKMQHAMAEAPAIYQVQPTTKSRSYLRLVKLD